MMTPIWQRYFYWHHPEIPSQFQAMHTGNDIRTSARWWQQTRFSLEVDGRIIWVWWAENPVFWQFSVHCYNLKYWAHLSRWTSMYGLLFHHLLKNYLTTNKGNLFLNTFSHIHTQPQMYTPPSATIQSQPTPSCYWIIYLSTNHCWYLGNQGIVQPLGWICQGTKQTSLFHRICILLRRDRQ